MSDRPDSRIDDYNILEKELRSSDPTARRQARMAKDALDRETPKERAMRDELVQAHRKYDKAKIEELHWRLRAERNRL